MCLSIEQDTRQSASISIRVLMWTLPSDTIRKQGEGKAVYRTQLDRKQKVKANKPNETKNFFLHIVCNRSTLSSPMLVHFRPRLCPPMMPPSPPWAYDADPHNSHGPVELSNSCSMTLIAGDSVRYNLNTLGAEYKPFGSYSTERDLSVFLYQE